MKTLAVILPLFNDWQSAATVVKALKSEFDRESWAVKAQIFVVDDGSTERAASDEQSAFSESNVTLISLTGNLGHQRAAVAGIRYAIKGDPDYILVMDADGEDRPDAIAHLIYRARKYPEEVVVAKRGARFEPLSFRMLYGAHKLLFRLLVGERLDFGNFVLLPISAARRIAQMPEASSHLAAGILKSRLPIQRVLTDRGTRHFGASKMNMERLLSHSFSSLSIFTERIMVRLLVFSFFATLFSAAAAVGVVAVRFFSDSTTPGWATVALGLLMVFSIQFLSFAGLGTLITLNVSTLRQTLPGESVGAKTSNSTFFSENSESRPPDRFDRASKDLD